MKLLFIFDSRILVKYLTEVIPKSEKKIKGNFKDLPTFEQV